MLKFFSDGDGWPLPAFACDVCGKPIDDLGMAIALRFEADGRNFDPLGTEIELIEGQPLVLVHKGECDRRLCAKFTNGEVTANREAVSSIATALYNGGVEDVPIDWFDELNPRQKIEPI